MLTLPLLSMRFPPVPTDYGSCRSGFPVALRRALLGWLALLCLMPTLYAADWANSYGASGANMRVLATLRDSTGNVYAAGYFDAASIGVGGLTLRKTGTQDAFLAKLDSTGTPLWVKNIGGSGATAQGLALASDSSGNVYLSGTYSGGNLSTHGLTILGRLDGFALKYTASGTLVWARNFGGTSGFLTAQGIAVDSSGNVLVTGHYNNANLTRPTLVKLGPSDAFVFKLNAAGTFVWRKTFGGPGASVRGRGIAVDATGNIFLGGDFDSAKLTSPNLARQGTGDAFVFRLDSAGAVQWAKSFGGPGAVARGQSIAVDDSGNVFLGGDFDTANLADPALPLTGTRDAFALKLDASGTTTWAKPFSGAGTALAAQSIATDHLGNVVLAGYFIGPGLNTPALPQIGNSDAFAVLLDAAGTTTWAQNFGGMGAFTYGQGVALDDEGNIYLGGSFNTNSTLFRPSVSITTPHLTSKGLQDAFLFRQTTRITVPDAPTHVVAVAGDSSALITYAAPVSYGGSPITRYTITADPPDGAPSEARSINLTQTYNGLVNGRSYRFTVTATNIAGTGSASVASIAVTPQGSQTLTFANPGDRTLETLQFSVTASSDAGLPVSFASTTPTTCSVAGNTVTLLSAGSCTLAADQPGNAAYKPASRVTQSFQVALASQTISFQNPGQHTVGQAVPLVTSASSGLPLTLVSATPALCSVSGTSATLLAGGTCTITASQAGDNRYAAASSVSQSFRIAKLDQTLTLSNPGPMSLPASPFMLAPVSSANLPVTLGSSTPSVCSVAANLVTPLTGGTCTLSAEQPGNSLYNSATPVSQSFIIARMAQSIAFSGPETLLVGAVSTLSAKASSGLAVTLTSANPAICRINGLQLTAFGAGVCALTASQAGNASYNPAGEVNLSLTIQPQPTAQLIWSSDSLVFPDTVIGSRFSASLVLTNAGGASASLGGVRISSGFTQTGTCSSAQTLAPGASCSVLVTFAPTVLGARSGTLTLGTSASLTPAVVNLSGLAVSPTPATRGACDGVATASFHALAVKDGDSKRFGQRLDILYCQRNFDTSKRFDLYVAVNVPQLGLVFLQSDNTLFGAATFKGQITPYLSNTAVLNLDGAVLALENLPAGLPTGTYSFYALAVPTGKTLLDPVNWVGNLPRADVEISE